MSATTAIKPRARNRHQPTTTLQVATMNETMSRSKVPDAEAAQPPGEIARDEVHCACIAVMQLRQELSEAEQAIKSQPGVLSARQAAYAIWRRMQAAEDRVRALPVDTLLAATTVSTPSAATDRLSIGDVLKILRAAEAGEDLGKIAKRYEMKPYQIREHIEKWKAGTSRVAKRAMERGMWPNGKVRS